jgi:DNA-binding winged helix-turn-helix (wHTH) protein
VIERVLTNNGALSKDDIIKKVLKERHVKENTILVNLQNRNYFKRDKRGHYTLI